MIEKCANPSCSTLFRRWGRGKVFAFETRTQANVSAASPGKTALFFWLCEACSSQHRLAIDAAGYIKIESTLPSLGMPGKILLNDAGVGKIA